MRVFMVLALVPATLAAQPALAAPAPPRSAPAAAVPADPERLALAREIARAFWPDGTIERMMASMGGVHDGVMKGMFEMTPNDLGADAGEEGKKTLGEYVREKDPHFEERMAITQRIMTEEIGKLMSAMEPEMRESIAQLYARRFSARELGDIAAFFRTPSGKHYGAELIPMMADPEYQKMMMQLAPKIMQAMPAVLDKVKKATAHLPPPPENAGDQPEKAPAADAVS